MGKEGKSMMDWLNKSVFNKEKKSNSKAEGATAVASEEDELVFLDESPDAEKTPGGEKAAKQEEIRRMRGEQAAATKSAESRGERSRKIRGRAGAFYEAGGQVVEGPQKKDLFDAIATHIEKIPNLQEYMEEKGIDAKSARAMAEELIEEYKQQTREQQSAIPPDVASHIQKLVQSKLQLEKAEKISDPDFKKQMADSARLQIQKVKKNYE